MIRTFGLVARLSSAISALLSLALFGTLFVSYLGRNMDATTSVCPCNALVLVLLDALFDTPTICQTGRSAIFLPSILPCLVVLAQRLDLTASTTA